MLLIILPIVSSFFFLSNFQISKKSISLFLGTERHTKLKLGPHMDSRLMYHVYLNQAAGAYLLLYFFNFLYLKFQNINFFLSLFSVRPTKLKLDTHMGKGLIYFVHQIQVARIYLFLYLSSFFCLSNQQRLETCFYKIVSTYLSWLWPGVCELCLLCAILYSAKIKRIQFSCSSEHGRRKS